MRVLVQSFRRAAEVQARPGPERSKGFRTLRLESRVLARCGAVAAGRFSSGQVRNRAGGRLASPANCQTAREAALAVPCGECRASEPERRPERQPKSSIIRRKRWQIAWKVPSFGRTASSASNSTSRRKPESGRRLVVGIGNSPVATFAKTGIIGIIRNVIVFDLPYREAMRNTRPMLFPRLDERPPWSRSCFADSIAVTSVVQFMLSELVESYGQN